MHGFLLLYPKINPILTDHGEDMFTTDEIAHDRYRIMGLKKRPSVQTLNQSRSLSRLFFRLGFF